MIIQKVYFICMYMYLPNDYVLVTIIVLNFIWYICSCYCVIRFFDLVSKLFLFNEGISPF